jgi:hypothetical protein
MKVENAIYLYGGVSQTFVLWTFDLQANTFSSWVNMRYWEWMPQKYFEHQYVPSSVNQPGSLMSAQCYAVAHFFFVAGGFDGYNYQSSIFVSYLGDWISLFRQRTPNFPGRYGIKGEYDSRNIPASRASAKLFSLDQNTLCLFSGSVVDEYYGDLWCFRFNATAFGYYWPQDTVSDTSFQLASHPIVLCENPFCKTLRWINLSIWVMQLVLIFVLFFWEGCNVTLFRLGLLVLCLLGELVSFFFGIFPLLFCLFFPSLLYVHRFHQSFCSFLCQHLTTPLGFYPVHLHFLCKF